MEWPVSACIMPVLTCSNPKPQSPQGNNLVFSLERVLFGVTSYQVTFNFKFMGRLLPGERRLRVHRPATEIGIPTELCIDIENTAKRVVTNAETLTANMSRNAGIGLYSFLRVLLVLMVWLGQAFGFLHRRRVGALLLSGMRAVSNQTIHLSRLVRF